jgi:hypothetical protein
MEFFKKICSAILISTLIALPISMLESLTIYSIINLYEIPYLISFKYYQILGISFIFMISRNRIKMEVERGSLMEQIISPSVNRIFRVMFVWSVSFIVHYILFR